MQRPPIVSTDSQSGQPITICSTKQYEQSASGLDLNINELLLSKVIKPEVN